jgi:NADH dehydrogenase
MEQRIVETPNSVRPGLPRVVIVGAGFGGLAAAHALRNAPVEIIVVDRHNYHLFQPLLYQVATASLSPAEIAQPIRSILKTQKNVHVILEEVSGADPAAKTLRTSDGRTIPYDYLLIATGARHSYFGHADWEANAPGIKSIDDATRVRAKILLAFERAEVEPNEAARRALLTFVIVGAGPTGVEMAGAIAELARNSITRDFRDIEPGSARIVLAEAGPRVLPAFSEPSSREAERVIKAMGVEVRLGTPVTSINAEGFTIGTEFIPARTIVWAAGVRASPAGQWLGAAVDRAGRVVVNAEFSVPGHDGVFVVGDAALFKTKNGSLLPGVAPAAKQAGAYVGRLIKSRVVGRATPKPFSYADYGSLATIGRRNAVVDFGPVHVSGFLGWLIWSVAHIYFLIGFRNRFVVALSWAWSYITYQRGARLITGTDEEA